MSTGTAAFIGTFDPMHGGHIGQLLRAQYVGAFARIEIAVDKHPLHKPRAAAWQRRLDMARLTLQEFGPSFEYGLHAVESSMADELKGIGCKITGIDSLLENLGDESRWPLALRWPMLVLSIPGVDLVALEDLVKTLPLNVRCKLAYEYVSEKVAPIMNHDFDKQAGITHRVHATGIRSGRDAGLIAPSVRRYIKEYGLYGAVPTVSR